MGNEPIAFLDTSVLFAAVLSETGGSRMILRLGEAGIVRLMVGPEVLEEADRVISRKASASRPLFALLLERALIDIGPKAGRRQTATARQSVSYLPDARIVAEALASGAAFFVTLDKEHFGSIREIGEMKVRTPGEFIADLRSSFSGPP